VMWIATCGLTSGSSSYNIDFSLLSRVVVTSLYRNLGPSNPHDSIRIFADVHLVARSAGLSVVSMYLHWDGSDTFRIIWTLLAT
jgi:hypothetical protein